MTFYDVRHFNSPRAVSIIAKTAYAAALEFAKEERLEENKFYSEYRIEVRNNKTKKSKFYIVERQTKITLKCRETNGISQG